VNGNGLQVFGTVTKTPVATGADLVAYSGFSESNYLQQPYNSDLDFGTGDFCYMGWVYATSAGAGLLRRIIDKRPFGASSNWQALSIGSDGTPFFYTNDGAASYVGTVTKAIPLDSWVFIVAVRTSTTMTTYVNGKEWQSVSATARNVSSTSTMRLGRALEATAQNFVGSLALWRISGTAPTEEQIKRIYEDEKVLFQDGSQATLYGSSDAVTALAYDDDTELLHVGTSAGRSVFSGLRRVDNTTDAVGSAISASNGLVVED
jgi:ligand-binding sensor domain-containing protein